jgi:hypothetical protein
VKTTVASRWQRNAGLAQRQSAAAGHAIVLAEALVRAMERGRTGPSEFSTP